MKNLHVRLSASVTEFRQQMGAAGQATRDFGREMDGAARNSKQAMQQIGKVGIVVGGAIVAGFAAATFQAAKFETSMRNVSTISKTTREDFAGVSAQILDLSRKVPQAATTLADGLYDIASSGFDGAEAMSVLNALAIAATAGLTDTATAARSITGILNAYGYGAEEAARVSDILFQTVNLGVVTFEELAQGVGNWVGTAAALKVPIEDASAALATMTLSGINAAEAHTALNRVMQSFIKPTDEMADRIRTLGYESGTAMVETLGLEEAVSQIGESTGGSVEQIANLYGEVRAIKGALALGADEGRNYARVTDSMADSSGAAAAAYAEQSKAFSVQLDLAKSSIAAFAIEIGTIFLPMATSAAQMIGGMADALGALPGPVKTVAAVLTGLAGVVALLGGAALLAAPRVLALRAAMSDLFPAGTRGAAGVTKLQGAMGKLLKGGMFVTAVVAGASALDTLTKAVVNAGRDAPPAAEEIVTSLGHLVRAGNEIGIGGESWTDYLDTFAASAGRVRDEMNRPGWTRWGMTPPKLDAAKDDVKAMDEALSSLLSQDYDAGIEAWEALQAEWEASGRPLSDLEAVLPKVTTELTNGAEETAAAKAEFEALKEEAKALGYDLDETSDLAGKTAEELAELAAATDPVIFGMLEAGAVTEAQAEAMQKALESFVDGVRSAFGSVTEPLGIYTTALADMNAASEKAWGESHDSMDGFVEKGSLSLGEFVGSMQDTVKDTQSFMDDINRAIEMGYDPKIIADLLMAGPEAAAPMLETLLSDHSGELVGLVNETVGALDDLNRQAAEMARLTHLATTATTSQMTEDLSTAMSISQQVMREGGKRSAEAIAQELQIGVDEVKRIAKAYGIELADGINPVLDGIGRPLIPRLAGYKMATGGTVPGVGDGDTVPAMLTPGEFVIRKAAVKAIGVDRLNELNYADRKRFAEGGYVMADDVPAPPDVSHRGSVVGHAGGEAMDHLYETVRKWVTENAIPSGSTTGLDPVFAQMFDRYNQALGGILSIISGFRSRASQERLYAKYLAGTGNLAARPGTSKHERGLAIDHAPRANASMKGTARGFGLHYPVRGEDWHVEPIHIRDNGGPLMPGLTWNGTGRPEMVVPHYAAGGLVERAVAGTHHRASLESVGRDAAWIAGVTDPAELEAIGRAYADLAETVDEATARMLMAEGLSAEGYADAARRIADEQQRLTTTLTEQYEERQTALDVAYAEGRMSGEDYVAALTERHERIEEIHGYWSREAHAIRDEIRAVNEQIADDLAESVAALASTRDDAFDLLNDMLDQQAAIEQKLVASADKHADQRARLEDRRADDLLRVVEKRNADLLRLEQDLADRRSKLIADREDELLDWIGVEERYAAGWGNTVGALTRNIAEQMTVFADWQDALADARQRGVSDAVIDVLGLEEGPQALDQLRMFASATDAEIAELNRTVEQRQAQAGDRASEEARQSYTELGGMLVSMTEVYADEVAAVHAEFLDGQRAIGETFAAEVEALNESFMEEQRALTAELAAIGTDQGRSYTESVAAGIRSGIPAIVAAAKAARDAQTAVTAGPATSTKTSTAFDEWYAVPANRAYYEWKMKGYAVGTAWVSETGPAVLHEGERVLSAVDNAALVRAVRSIGQPSSPVVNVSIDVDRMKAVVRSEAAGVIDERTIDVQIAGRR